MDHFIDRLNWLIDKYAKGRPFTFAKRSGIPPSTFQSYKKDRLPDAKHLIGMYKFCGVNLNWLLTGEGERTIGELKNGLSKISAEIDVLNERRVEIEKSIARNEKIRSDDPPEKRDELVKLRAV